MKILKVNEKNVEKILKKGAIVPKGFFIGNSWQASRIWHCGKTIEEITQSIAMDADFYMVISYSQNRILKYKFV